MNFSFFEAGGNIKKNKFIVPFCIFIIALSLCACEDNGADMENSYQISHEESSASDDVSQTDDEVNLSCLRYDGLYCYLDDFNNNGLIENSVLRFYEDGFVINVSTEQTESGGRYFPREKWFNREDENLTAVSYECIDDKISFTTVDQNGTVDYCGTIQQDQLILDIHSNINGNEESNREYVFYPFEDIPGWYN